MNFPNTKIPVRLSKDLAHFDTRFTGYEYPELYIKDDQIEPVDYWTTTINVRVFIRRITDDGFDIILPDMNPQKREWRFKSVKHDDDLIIGDNQHTINKYTAGDQYEWFVE